MDGGHIRMFIKMTGEVYRVLRETEASMWIANYYTTSVREADATGDYTYEVSSDNIL